MSRKKVLIIQLARMGDIIQTLPLLKRLNEHIDSVQITFTCVKEFSHILNSTRLIHRFIKIPALDVYKLCCEHDDSILNRVCLHPFLCETYDLVVNLTHDSVSGVISNSIRAREKTGVVKDGKSTEYIPDKWGRYLFSVVHKRKENSFNLVDIHVGMGTVPHMPVRRFLNINPLAWKRVEELLRFNGVEKNCRLVGLHLGASTSYRVWPVEYFVELAGNILIETDATVVLTGAGDNEIHASEDFMKISYKRGYSLARIVNLVGKTSLAELTALLARLDLLVACDTGPIHIAAAVGTPTLGLYMATAFPGETAPYGEGHVVITPTAPCYPCLQIPQYTSCELKCRHFIRPETIFHICRFILENRRDDLFYWHIPEDTEVQISVARFLANGTLMYVPIRHSTDPVFARQVAERYMWEAILGLDPDSTIAILPNRELLIREITARLVTIRSLYRITLDALAILHNHFDLKDNKSLKEREIAFFKLLSTLGRQMTVTLLEDFFCFMSIPCQNQPLQPEDIRQIWAGRHKDLGRAFERYTTGIGWVV